MPNNIRSYPTVWIYLLLFLMAFQALGWLMVLQGIQWDVRRQAEYLISQETTPINTRTIPFHLFENIRVGRREIRLEGHLYDIKSVTHIQDSVRLELYHDRAEEKLVRHWRAFWSGSQESNSPTNQTNVLLVKWMGSIYLELQQSDFALNILLPHAQRPPHWQAYTAAQSAPSVLSPPPEA